MLTVFSIVSMFVNSSFQNFDAIELAIEKLQKFSLQFSLLCEILETEYCLTLNSLD